MPSILFSYICALTIKWIIFFSILHELLLILMLQLQTRLTNFWDIKTFDRAAEKFNNSSLVKWPIWVKFQFNSLQLFSQIIFVWLKISCQWQSNKQFKYLDQLQNIQMNIFRAAHNRYWKSIFAADMFVKCSFQFGQSIWIRERGGRYSARYSYEEVWEIYVSLSKSF